MAKTLAQLNAEIRRLQAEADVIRNKERDEVITRIKEAIAVYGLTAADLGIARRGRDHKGEGGGTVERTARGKSSASRRKASVIKYRDDRGNTWSGHGRRPKWYLGALASGKSEGDLLA